jgi:2-dehydro-3-deoxygluconokinase
MSKLNVLPLQEGGLDFLSLGALVCRLDPGIIPFHKATSFQAHVSGGEFNVAANLSDCFELNTGIATAMVKYRLGRLIQERVRAMGVKPFYVWFERDGVWGPNMALVFSDRGYDRRGPEVDYNRANEAAAQLEPDAFNWEKIFKNGVRWFHSGGIFTSLSDKNLNLIIEAMKFAKSKGAVTSFDINYRARLWKVRDGKQLTVDTMKQIIPYVDVLVGNEGDLQDGLDISGPDVAKQSKLDTSVFVAMMNEVTKQYPNVKAVATTLREELSANKHNWSAVAWVDGKIYQAPTCELNVYDRVGGGDGFASGFFYGLLTGRSPEEAVKLGWAHGALLTTTPGDTTMVTLEQVENFVKGAHGRIQR